MVAELVRVGLVFGYGLAYYRQILRGIKAYAESQPSWVFTPIAPEAATVGAIRRLALDGLIAHVFTHELARALAHLRKPVVNVSGVLPELPFPGVMPDHAAAGRVAAEHLLDRGLRHFGFVGYPDHAFSTGREAGFRRAVEGAGFCMSVYHADNPLRPEPTGLWCWDDRLGHWLSSLPRPVGILASHDIQGVQLSEACRRSGLKVPDDVALVGVDNDDLLCELARPALSSVALPAERIGFEAAKLLQNWITRGGRQPPRRPILLPPLGVAVRPSSDVLAIDDEDVAAAVRFIRSHTHQPIQVRDVLGAVPVSRRSLERRFRSILGRAVGEEIRRAHMERARSLLATSDMPIARVAASAGFSEAKHLSTVFRQETGMTPSQYRRQTRTEG